MKQLLLASCVVFVVGSHASAAPLGSGFACLKSGSQASSAVACVEATFAADESGLAPTSIKTRIALIGNAFEAERPAASSPSPIQFSLMPGGRTGDTLMARPLSSALGIGIGLGIEADSRPDSIGTSAPPLSTVPAAAILLILATALFAFGACSWRRLLGLPDGDLNPQVLDGQPRAALQLLSMVPAYSAANRTIAFTPLRI